MVTNQQQQYCQLYIVYLADHMGALRSINCHWYQQLFAVNLQPRLRYKLKAEMTMLMMMMMMRGRAFVYVYMFLGNKKLCIEKEKKVCVCVGYKNI